MNAMQHKRGPLFLGCCIQWLDAESLGRRIEIRYIHTPRRDERREIRKRTFFFPHSLSFFFFFPRSIRLLFLSLTRCRCHRRSRKSQRQHQERRRRRRGSLSVCHDCQSVRTLCPSDVDDPECYFLFHPARPRRATLRFTST